MRPALSRARRVAVVCTVVAALGSSCDDTDPEAAEPTLPPTTLPAGAPAGASTTTEPCGPGGRTLAIGEQRVREFCGPARAEVTAGRDTLVFEDGECSRHPDWFAVNLGVEVVDPDAVDEVADPQFRSFTILMGRHPLATEAAAPISRDGVYTEGTLTFTIPGATYLVDDKTITLLATRTAGTFSGVGFLDKAPDRPIEVEGSFTCDAGTIPMERIPELMEAETDA